MFSVVAIRRSWTWPTVRLKIWKPNYATSSKSSMKGMNESKSLRPSFVMDKLKTMASWLERMNRSKLNRKKLSSFNKRFASSRKSKKNFMAFRMLLMLPNKNTRPKSKNFEPNSKQQSGRNEISYMSSRRDFSPPSETRMSSCKLFKDGYRM